MHILPDFVFFSCVSYYFLRQGLAHGIAGGSQSDAVRVGWVGGGALQFCGYMILKMLSQLENVVHMLFSSKIVKFMPTFCQLNCKIPI